MTSDRRTLMENSSREARHLFLASKDVSWLSKRKNELTSYCKYCFIEYTSAHFCKTWLTIIDVDVNVADIFVEQLPASQFNESLDDALFRMAS